jgi:hypothetical protein
MNASKKIINTVRSTERKIRNILKKSTDEVEVCYLQLALADLVPSGTELEDRRARRLAWVKAQADRLALVAARAERKILFAALAAKKALTEAVKASLKKFKWVRARLDKGLGLLFAEVTLRCKEVEASLMEECGLSVRD